MRPALLKAEAVLVQANQAALIALLGGMSVLVFVNVLGRYATGYSIPWAEEVARHAMIWLTFLGCGLVLRAGGHIAIDNLQDAVPPRAARWLRAGILVLVAGFVAVLGFAGMAYVERTMFQTTAATQIPFGYVYLAMPVGCALTLAHLAFVARDWVVDRRFRGDDGFDANASAAL